MAKRKKLVFTEEELQNPRTPEQFRLALRRKTRMFYDIQEMRLQAQGRLTKKSPGSEIELHPMDLKRLEARLQDLEATEKNALGDLEDQLEEVAFYTQVIKSNPKYRGLGPRMASVILSSFDIEKEDTVSKMWSFAGLAPIEATRCKACNATVERVESIADVQPVDGPLYRHPTYKAPKCEFSGKLLSPDQAYASGKAMKPVSGEKLKYNSWLRSKLCGVLGSVLLQVGSPFRKQYDDYKHRKQTAGWGVSDAHRHNASIRYMIKMLLLDLWKEWRTFEKLPVRPSYHEEKQGGHGFKIDVKELSPQEYEVNEEAQDELASLGL